MDPIRCFRNIAGLVMIAEQDTPYLGGEEMDSYEILENAFLSIQNGRILDFGSMDSCPSSEEYIYENLDGRFIFPAWCDSHTHIVFAGSREKEYVMRMKGKSYEEIATSGGGILNSARLLQNTSHEELLASAEKRLWEVIGFGTGAIEIKSGYGLSLNAELKMLRVIKDLKARSPIPIKSTFLGAHAIPGEYKDRRNEYIKLITEEMLPIIAEEKLADYCDVFCDRGFFTVEETDSILKKAHSLGMKAKIHANELDYSGGVQVGVWNGAISVDHLECVGEEEISCLLNSDTMATILPSTAFFLGLEYAPARKMIDAGLPVALASDYNPGSSPSGNMPFVLSLASLKMKMTPRECIAAATLNGARALELEQELGSITRGKKANLIITRQIPSLDYFTYAFGSQNIERVLVNGEELLNRHKDISGKNG